MVKFFVYAEGSKKPIQRKKHESDALLFISDFKNLQQYGCMTLVREDDSGERQVWNNELKAWVVEE